MLKVKTPQEALELIRQNFADLKRSEEVPLAEACGRTLAQDTFGCSDSMPAILKKSGKVDMGTGAAVDVNAQCCVAVPTGGEVPKGADAMVMVEYTEDYGDGTIGILKPAAPGANMSAMCS